MMQYIWNIWTFVSDPNNRALLSWLGGGLVVIVAGLWKLFKWLIVSKASDSDAPGGSVTNTIVNNVTIPIDHIETNAERRHQDVLSAIARDKGISEASLRPTLARLGIENCAPADIPQKLEEAANELLQLRAGLSRLPADEPQFNVLRKEALAWIDQGDFAKADAVLEEGRKLAQTARLKAARLEVDFLGDRARLALLQLNYDDASAKLREGLDIDPANIVMRIELGDLERRRGAFSLATEAYREAAHRAEQRGLKRFEAAALDRLGTHFLTSGNLTDALEYYQKAHLIAKYLAAQAPANAQVQRDLIVSYSRIGEILATQGKLIGSLIKHRSSLSICERRAALDPDNAEAQRDLSFAFSKIGEILIKQGDLSGALENYRKALAIVETLAALDSNNAQAQHDLATTYNNIAAILIDQGDLSGAADYHRKTLALQK